MLADVGLVGDLLGAQGVQSHRHVAGHLVYRKADDAQHENDEARAEQSLDPFIAQLFAGRGQASGHVVQIGHMLSFLFFRGRGILGRITGGIRPRGLRASANGHSYPYYILQPIV